MNEWKKKPPLKAWHFAFLCEREILFLSGKGQGVLKEMPTNEKIF